MADGIRFHTTIVQSGKNTTGIEVPPEVVEALGAGKRPKVKVTIGEFSYRSSIATMGGVPMVSLSAENRAGAGVAGGDDVEVELALDLEKRVVTVPPDLAAAMDAVPPAPCHLREPVVQQPELARAPGGGGKDRRDTTATDRQVCRDARRRPPTLTRWVNASGRAGRRTSQVEPRRRS